MMWTTTVPMSENLPAENIPTQRNEQSFDADEPRLDRDYQRSESFEQRPDSDEEKVVNASLAQLARGEKEGPLEKHLDSNNVDLEKNSLDESDNNDEDDAEQSEPVPELKRRALSLATSTRMFLKSMRVSRGSSGWLPLSSCSPAFLLQQD